MDKPRTLAERIAAKRAAKKPPVEMCKCGCGLPRLARIPAGVVGL